MIFQLSNSDGVVRCSLTTRGDNGRQSSTTTLKQQSVSSFASQRCAGSKYYQRYETYFLCGQ